MLDAEGKAWISVHLTSLVHLGYRVAECYRTTRAHCLFTVPVCVSFCAYALRLIDHYSVIQQYSPPSPYPTPYPPANNFFPIPIPPPPNYTPHTSYIPLPQQNPVDDSLYRLPPSPPFNGSDFFSNEYNNGMANTSPYMAGSQAGVWHTHNGH